MSNNLIPELESSFPVPDFSEGEEFLLSVRATLRHRQHRRTFATSLTTTVSAALLFVLSFSVIQQQVDEELWEQHLLSEMVETVDSPELDSYAWDLYLESLLQEEDLNLLLEEILYLEGGEERLLAINL